MPLTVIKVRPELAEPHLKIGDFAPGGSSEAVGVVGPGINDRLIASDDVGDQMTGARPDTEAVAAEVGSEDETGQGGDLADPWRALQVDTLAARPPMSVAS